MKALPVNGQQGRLTALITITPLSMGVPTEIILGFHLTRTLQVRFVSGVNVYVPAV